MAKKQTTTLPVITERISRHLGALEGQRDEAELKVEKLKKKLADAVYDVTEITKRIEDIRDWDIIMQDKLSA